MYDGSKTVIHIVLAFLLHFCATLYVILRFWMPLSISLTWKAAGIFLCLASYTAPYAAVLIDRWTSFPLSASFYVAGYSLTFVFVIFPAAFVGLRDASILLYKLFRRNCKTQHVATDRRQALAFIGASAGLTGFGMNKGLQVPDIRRMDATFASLPEALIGMKVVQLSDIHASTLLPKEHIVSIVQKVNALQPDLILITGDIADGVIPVRYDDLTPLADLKATLGVFGCEGNHEHYVSDYEDRIQQYKKLGIRMLRNECVHLQYKRCRFTLAGITDEWARKTGRDIPNPAKAFRHASPEGFRILMAHQPGLAHIYERVVRYDWQLSGHTHGGQMMLMDWVVDRINNHRLKGWYMLEKAKLYVHSGTGTASRYPLRLGVPGEIALFTLRKS